MKQSTKNRGAQVDGICFFGGNRRECLSLLAERMVRAERTAVFTPNPVMLENAVRDPDFHAVLRRAELKLPDGVGVVLAARLLGEGRLCRLSGVDMARGVLALAAKRGYRVFLLGGRAGVAEEAARRLKARLPRLCVCGTRSGYFSAGESAAVLEQIRRSRADILLVCLGSPRQETWIDRNREALGGVRLFMALGGTLDVFAGRVRRAPVFVQSVGLEWLWRMALEPRRFRDLPKMVAFSRRTLEKSFENIRKSCHCAQMKGINFSILKNL